MREGFSNLTWVIELLFTFIAMTVLGKSHSWHLKGDLMNCECFGSGWIHQKKLPEVSPRRVCRRFLLLGILGVNAGRSSQPSGGQRRWNSRWKCADALMPPLACVFSLTHTHAHTHTHTRIHAQQGTSADFRIKRRIHYGIIKSAWKKRRIGI